MDAASGGAESGSGTEAGTEDAQEGHLIEGPYGLYDPRPRAYGSRDPGGGPYNEETGLRDWYAPESSVQKEKEEAKPVQIPWTLLLDNWTQIELDLHELYGIDVESGVLKQRTWRWLRNRIQSLIHMKSRIGLTAAEYTEEQLALREDSED